MLDIYKLQELEDEVNVALRELFETAKSNQQHKNDLAIAIIGGFHEHNSNNKLDYGIGMGMEGIRWRTHSQFMIDYFTNYCVDGNKVESNKGLFKDKFEKIRGFTINFELMLYLKFWESDYIIKKLYQLTELASGKPYDWSFLVGKFSAKNDGKITDRQEIIRVYIRDKIKNLCPLFSKLISDTFYSSIRNAVAHSHYVLMGNSIANFPTNGSKSHAPFPINYDDWEVIFHKVYLINNLLRRIQDEYESKYKSLTPITISIPNIEGKYINKNIQYDGMRWTV